MIPRDPLSGDELDWLDRILLDRVDEDAVTDGSDEGILCIPELDGYLTAIVSGPTVVAPSRWLPAMWGDFEPVWEKTDELQRFMSLLMRHSNSIAGLLMSTPEAFEPIFFEREVEDATVTIVDEWCEGYMRAVRLTGEEWGRGGKEIAELLEPIRSFTEETDWSAHELDDVIEMTRIQESIAPAARAIHAVWLASRSHPQTPTRRDGPRIGRNDPCPCGSGKKYKRCCLQ